MNQRCRSKAEFGLVGLLFNVLPIVCETSVFMFCYALFWVHPSFAIILKRLSKLVALLLLSYRCITTINVMWFFLMVKWVGLKCMIVVFLHHTHLVLSCICIHSAFMCPQLLLN